MPTHEETLAFEHGIRFMIQCMEGCANIAQGRGEHDHAKFLYDFVDEAETCVKEITAFYMEDGYENIMRWAVKVSIMPEK